MLKWRKIEKDFISFDVGQAFNEKPFYWTAFYYYKGLIIDTGCPLTAEESVNFIENMKLRIEAILITHSHEDHSGGAHFFQKRLKADVFAPKKSIEVLKNPPEIPTYRQKVWGQPKPVVAEPLRERMKFSELELLTFNTPGHSSDHVSFLAEDKLFMGDLIANLSPVIIMKQEDYIDLISSLKNVLKLNFKIAYGGHGIWEKNEIKEAFNAVLRLKKSIENLQAIVLSPVPVEDRH